MEEMIDYDEMVKVMESIGLDDRQIRLVANCVSYSVDDPAGMPGHNLALIIVKLTRHIVKNSN